MSVVKHHRVVFIGAGPGAVDLITLRGAQRLAECEVVLFDALTDPGFRDLAPQARWIDVGKRGFSGLPGCDANGQTRINALLVSLARRGLRVARLKGGDPSVFGRLEEELLALAQAGLEAEVVPGVTAALAAAAAAQRPLTRRGTGRSVSLTTAMTRAGTLQDGAALAAKADTEVFYMAGKQLAALQRRLREAGWAQDAAVLVVSRAGCADELVSTHRVDNLAQASVVHAGRPTVVTVGVGARELADDRHCARSAKTAPVEPGRAAAPPMCMSKA
ncbi:MAG TPA: uroporphyrinogen-III C-methyltransferase [Burkholderiaceae bacterium]|jgi:uroporphyrin-III C-methyltransferase|nr:uroporphyrinogen-III C-methyltransferase [Burkholderiaceae bacterium]